MTININTANQKAYILTFKHHRDFQSDGYVKSSSELQSIMWNSSHRLPSTTQTFAKWNKT